MLQRSLVVFLATSAFIWKALGYLPTDIDSYASACNAVLVDALDTRCPTAQNQAAGPTEATDQKKVRRNAIGALWQCQGLLESNRTSGAKLRVLLWDAYEPWLRPALGRFSDLYSIPLDLDIQPYERLMPSIRGVQAGGGAWEAPLSQPPPQLPLPQRQWQQPGGASPHAVWLHSSADTQQLAAEGRLVDFGDLVEKEEYSLDWFDVGQSYRLHLMPYAGRTVAMPLDGTLLHLFYRADVMSALGLLEIPQTWTQLIGFATSYGSLLASGGAPAGWGALPPFPICIARDVGCRHESYLQAIWSSITQTHGSSQAIHFDAATMRPLLSSAASDAAFRILAQLLAAAAPLEADEGCSHGSLGFARGRCALALAGFVPQMQMLSASRGAVGSALQAGAVVRVSELPGSELVWDGLGGGNGGGTGAGVLTHCTPTTCPYGTPVTAAAVTGTKQGLQEQQQLQQQQQQQQQAEMLANRAPQVATSLLVGSINARMSPLARLVGFELLAFLASPGLHGTEDVEPTLPLRSAFPVRPRLLQPNLLAAWAAAGYDSGLMREAMPVLYGSMTHPNMAWGLRMPGQAPYRELVGDVVASIQAGNVSVDPWVAGSAAAASKATQPGRPTLTQVLSLGSARLTGFYTTQNSSALYEGSRQPWVYAPMPVATCQAGLAASPAASGPRSHSVVVPVLLGVIVPLLVVGLALVLGAHFRCCRSVAAAALCGVGYGRGTGCLSVAPRGSRKMHVPAAGVEVALCVTDIQDSTSLWESLPADTLARAVDIHHRCVRSLALRHGGYESATEGDSFILAFGSVRAAVSFALDLQTQLLNTPSWPKLLLEQEVCRPVYTRLPAGYPFSHAANSRTATLSPQARRSSWGVMGVAAATPSVVVAGTDPAAAAAEAAVSAALRLPVDPTGDAGRSGTHSGGGAAPGRVPPSPLLSHPDRFRSSTDGMVLPLAPQPLRHCAASAGSAISRAGIAAFPRGRSMGDLVHPTERQRQPRPSSVAGSATAAAAPAVITATTAGSSGHSRLNFPEDVDGTATLSSFRGGSIMAGGSAAAAAPAAVTAAAAACLPPHSATGWCTLEECSLAGASGAEEMDSAATPPAQTLLVQERSFNPFKQQLSWPGEPLASDSSSWCRCRQLGGDDGCGCGVGRRESLTCRELAGVAAEGCDPATALPSESDLPLRPHRRHHEGGDRQAPLAHQQQHQYYHRQQRQQQQRPALAQGSVVGRGPDQQPIGDSEPLSTWWDSGPLAAANFSVNSNTTYVTTMDGNAAAGATSFVTAGRLWDDGDGDFVSSASNAVFLPTSVQSVRLGQGPVSGAAGDGAAVAGLPTNASASPARGMSSAGGSCQTLLEALQAAAVSAISRRATGAGIDDQSPSGQLQPTQSQAGAAAPQGPHHNHHSHHHGPLLHLHQPHEHLMFRGLRVRVGISVAVPSAAELQYNAAAARMVYGGPCVGACKALADLAHGGQVFLSARAHRVLAAECQGLGGKPPGAMVLQVGLVKSDVPPPPPLVRAPGSAAAAGTPQPPSPQPPSAAAANAASYAGLARDSGLLLSADALALQSWRKAELQSPLPRVPEHASPKQQQQQQPPPQAAHQSSLAAMRGLALQLGMEPVYVVTAPTLSQRLALLPPPRFPSERPALQDVYRAPLGRVSYAVVRVPAAAALLRWDGQVAAESMRLFVATAVSELRRAPGAYLVSVTPAEVRAAFPSPVIAVAWALQLRTALLRAPWPEQLLQHELGEAVEVYEGGGGGAGTELSQPPSESGTPRLRWTSLAAFRSPGGGNCSREGNGKRSGGGGGGGSHGGSASGAVMGGGGELTRWELMQLRGAQRRRSGRPTVGQMGSGTAALSRAELLHAASTESDGDNGSAGGLCPLEPLPRIGASPPLRRHRHSIDCFLPASTPPASMSASGAAVASSCARAAVTTAGITAAVATCLPESDAPSDSLAGTGAATGPDAPAEDESSGLSPQDHRTRALALLAQHLLRNPGGGAGGDKDGSNAGDGWLGGGVAGGSASGSASGGGSTHDYLPTTPSTPSGLLPLGSVQPPVRPHALRRTTADGVAASQPHRHAPQPLQQQRSRMAAPGPVAFRHPQPGALHQLLQHEVPEAEEAAAGVSATSGPAPQRECQLSFRGAGADIRAAGPGDTTDGAEEDSELGLAAGGAAAAGASLLNLFASGRGGGARGGGGGGARAGFEPLCASDQQVSLPGNNSGLSRLNTWASSYLYGAGSGAAPRAGGSAVSDDSSKALAVSPAGAEVSEVGPASSPTLGQGPASLGAPAAAVSACFAGAGASVAARSAPLFPVLLTRSPRVSRRSHHDAANAAAVAAAAAAGHGATAPLQQTGAARTGRLLLRGLRVHVGVATGNLDWAISGKTHELVYSGRAVARAVRLSEAAPSGKVLCDRATHRAALQAQQTQLAQLRSPAAGAGPAAAAPVALQQQFAQAQAACPAERSGVLSYLRPGLIRTDGGSLAGLSGGLALAADGCVDSNHAAAAPASWPTAAMDAAAAGATAGFTPGGEGGAVSADRAEPDGTLTERAALDLQLVRLFAGARLSVRATDEAFLCELRSEQSTAPTRPARSLSRAGADGSPGPPSPSPAASARLTAHASAPSNIAAQHRLGSDPVAATLLPPAPAAAVARQPPARLHLTSPPSSRPLPTSGSPRTPHTPPTPPTPPNPRPSGVALDSEPRPGSWGGGGGGAPRPGRPPRFPVQLPLSRTLADSGEERQYRARFAWRRASGAVGSSPGLLALSGSGSESATSAATPGHGHGYPSGGPSRSGPAPVPAQCLWPQYSLGDAVAAAARAAFGGGARGGSGGGGGASQEVPERGRLPASSSALPHAAEGAPQRPPVSGALSSCLTGASDCGLAVTASMPVPSSGLLSTATGSNPLLHHQHQHQQQQSSSMRLSPAQRFRSVTADGYYSPYIICERVDEEGEGCCSEDASGRAGTAAGTGATLGGRLVGAGSEAALGSGPSSSVGAARTAGRWDASCDGVGGGDGGGGGGGIAARGFGGAGDSVVSRGLFDRTNEAAAAAANGDDDDDDDATARYWSRGNSGLDASAVNTVNLEVEPDDGPSWSPRGLGKSPGVGPWASGRPAVAVGLPAALMELGGAAGAGATATIAQVAAERLPPPLARAWRWPPANGRSETPRCAGAHGLPAGPGDWAESAGSGGGEDSSPDGCRSAGGQGPVEGEFEFVTNSRCCSATGGGGAGPEFTVRSLLQGRLLAQMAAAAATALKHDGAAAPAAPPPPAAGAQSSVISPTLLLTVGSSGRRGSAHMSGNMSSYLFNSGGSGGGMMGPPTFAGLAQLPPGGLSEASSTGSSFRLVPPQGQQP